MVSILDGRSASACVLAGGRGRRMDGADKLFVEFGGERLLSRIVRGLGELFDEVLVSGSRTEALEGLGARVVADRLPGRGPLSGLASGLEAASGAWVYLVACDMPYLSAPWIRALSAALGAAWADGSSPDAAALSSGPYFEPFHAFYHTRLAGPAFEALASGATSSIQGFMRGRSLALVPRSASGFPDEGLFTNCNTPDELASARACRETAPQVLLSR